MLKRMSLYLGVGLLILLTALGAAVHGRLTNRWGEPADLSSAAARLGQLPIEFGAWRMTQAGEFDEATLRILQCSGYLNRTYVHETTGEVVMLVVMAGPPGPMSVHTPEVCYSSREFQVREEPTRRELDAESGLPQTFWRMQFRTLDVAAEILEVWYAWSTGRQWEAPNYPRFSFGASPLLYKVQIASYVPPGVRSDEARTCESFLTELLPILDQLLVTTPSS